MLKTSSVSWALAAAATSITEATSHAQVVEALDTMASYQTTVKIPAVADFFCSVDWYSSLEKCVQFIIIIDTKLLAKNQSKCVYEIMKNSWFI